ncbi:MAG: DUF424 family protein [Halobacteriales archaeon]|nr:DUF424 family protein [Halobacteriales archaeon]
MIVLETYDTEQGLMVAAADASVVGELFEEGEVRIDVDEEFYGSRDATVPREEVVNSLRSAAIANLVGERAVEAGIEANVVDEENVLRVAGVPHAQMVRL